MLPALARARPAHGPLHAMVQPGVRIGHSVEHAADDIGPIHHIAVRLHDKCVLDADLVLPGDRSIYSIYLLLSRVRVLQRCLHPGSGAHHRHDGRAAISDRIGRQERLPQLLINRADE